MSDWLFGPDRTSFGKVNQNDWIAILSNVTFIVVIQTLFFWYIASQQYTTVLKEKIKLVRAFADKFPEIKSDLNLMKAEYSTQNAQITQEQEAKRMEINIELVKDRVIPFLYVLGGLYLLVFIWKAFVRKQPWSNVDTWSLIFVLTAYCTELFFFFFIVQKYEFVGDHHIIHKIDVQ
jgi:hypothetical protein